MGFAFSHLDPSLPIDQDTRPGRARKERAAAGPRRQLTKSMEGEVRCHHSITKRTSRRVVGLSTVKMLAAMQQGCQRRPVAATVLRSVCGVTVTIHCVSALFIRFLGRGLFNLAQ